MGGAGVNALAFGRPSAKPCQIGFGPRFIEKYQFGRIPTRLLFAPAPPRPGNVRTILLAGAERLFLYVSPIFPKTTLIACREHFSPLAARSSLSVKSFFLASKARKQPRWVATIIGLRPE